MTAAPRSQLKWLTPGIEINLLLKLKFLRPFVNMYNPQLNNRYSSVLGNQANLGKSITDLALKDYLAENPSAESIPNAFKEAAIAQIKLSIPAGHDTTPPAITFTYDLLSKHPNIPARVRAEHDAVFG